MTVALDADGAAVTFHLLLVQGNWWPPSEKFEFGRMFAVVGVADAGDGASAP